MKCFKQWLLIAAALLPIAVAAAPPVVDAGAERHYVAKTERGRLVQQIVRKWAGYVDQVYGTAPSQWTQSMAGTFADADLANLRKAAGRQTFEAMVDVISGRATTDEQAIDRLARSGGVTGKLLGSLQSDLVFTPITPCRITDTRAALGRIPANGERALDASNPAGNFVGQGGSNTNCGIPANPAALAISVTGLNNTNAGYLRVYPHNGTNAQGSSVPLPAANTNVTNDMIVPACQFSCAQELKIFSTANTHYAVFVTGYFMAPQATSLDCVTTDPVTVTLTGNGATVSSLDCPAGYASVGVDCNTQWEMADLKRFNSTMGWCSWSSPNSVTDTYSVSRRCCRVGGR